LFSIIWLNSISISAQRADRAEKQRKRRERAERQERADLLKLRENLTFKRNKQALQLLDHMLSQRKTYKEIMAAVFPDKKTRDS
jgi:transposase